MSQDFSIYERKLCTVILPLLSAATRVTSSNIQFFIHPLKASFSFHSPLDISPSIQSLMYTSDASFSVQSCKTEWLRLTRIPSIQSYMYPRDASSTVQSLMNPLDKSSAFESFMYPRNTFFSVQSLLYPSVFLFLEHHAVWYWLLA